MLPWVGMSSPLTMLSKVDFPQPLGPMTTQNSPSLMLRETSCMASVSTPLRTKVLLTCVTSMVFGTVIFLLRSADQDIVGKGAGPRREPLQHVGKKNQGHPGHNQQDEHRIHLGHVDPLRARHDEKAGAPLGREHLDGAHPGPRIGDGGPPTPDDET